MKQFLLALTLFMSVFANAGQESHGGNIVTCFNKETVTLDYYNAALPTVGGPADIVELSQWSEDEVIDFIRSRLKNSLFLELFDSAIEKFGPVTDWPLADLKDVNDAGEPYFLPQGCKRATAAIRQSNTIYVDPNLYGQLSQAQRGILYVHEMLYFISGQDSSTPVREMLRTFLKNKPTQSEIIKATRLVGPYYDYQFIDRALVYQMDEPGYQKQTIQFNGSPERKNYITAWLSMFSGQFFDYGDSYLDCRENGECKMGLKRGGKDLILKATFPTTTTLNLSGPDGLSFKFIRIN